MMDMMSVERKIHKDREEILHFVNTHNKIYVYGMGKAGKYITKYLASEDVKVSGFIVTKKTEEQMFDDIPVFVVSRMSFKESDGIIIAVRESLQQEILSTLLEAGVKESNIYGQKIVYTHDGALVNYSGKFRKYNEDNGNYFSNFSFLDGIGIKTGTDKSSMWHNYLSKYEFFFERYRNEEISILELGVFKGDSLRTWKNYFPNALVYGVDIKSDTVMQEEERIRIIVGDLDEYDFIQSLKSISPKIIIDDASHKWSQQIVTLCTLYDSIPSGGIYIMEDIETSFAAWKHRGYDNAILSGYELCEAITKVVASGEFLNPREESAAVISIKEEIYDIASKTSMVSYINGSCIFVKN